MASRRFPQSPLNSTTTLINFATFALGPLDGQNGWTLDAATETTLSILNNGVENNVTLTNVNGANVSSPLPLTPTDPWSITYQIKILPGLDQGGEIRLGLGDESTLEDGCIIDWAVGGFGATQCTAQLSDSLGGPGGGPFTFPTGTAVPVVLAYDGTDLTLTINGALALTVAAAVIGAITPTLFVKGQVFNGTDEIDLLSITVTS